MSTPVRRWPLVLIAAPAAVAIWSGWVGLGGMCGFGLVQPFPGIVSWHLDTAITLPVGVEAYGAFALGVWIRPGAIPDRAREFARKSAIGALAVGMAGQVIFHLLVAAGAQHAPWPVVVLVSCLPVVVLGLGAGLTHMLTADASDPATGSELPAGRDATGEPAPADASADASDPVSVRAQLNGHAAKSEKAFAADITAGKVPGVRRIQQQLHVGQPKAKLVQAHLRNVLGDTAGDNR